MARSSTVSNHGRAFLIGPEDLEPDFAQDIYEVSQIARNMSDTVEKMGKANANLREVIVSSTKEDNSKFREEVRQTLNEHFEYIKEIHNQLESQLLKNRHDHKVIVEEFKVFESEFKKLMRIGDR